MTWTTPRTWVAGEKPTAATMNTHIRDNLATIGGPWTSFVSSWTGTTTNPVIGNGAITGGYMWADKTVMFWIHVLIGSTTTFGSGNYRLSMPPPAEQAVRWSFNGVARDDSATNSWPIIGERDTAGLISLRGYPTTAGNQFRSLTSAIPFTFATSDTITVHGTYEAA